MTTPTLKEIYDSIIVDLQNKFGITSLIGKYVFSAFAAAQAAQLKLFYISIDFIYKNIFVDTADAESLGGTLERFGRVRLGRSRNAATAGEYVVNISGDIGATVPAQTTLKSLDTSTSPDKLYVVDSDFTLSSDPDTMQIRALDLGGDALLVPGDELQLTSPIANVNSFLDVNSVTTTPTEAESVDDYRKKVIQSYQLEAQGGAKGDYILWAADAAGVRQVYPYVKSGYVGEINLYVEATVADSTDGYGTPPASMLTDVENVVEFDPDITKADYERARRPISAFQIYYLAPILKAVDVEIVGLSDASLLTSITASIYSYLQNIRPYIDGADAASQINKGKLYLSDIFQLVKNITSYNATFTDIVMKIDTVSKKLYEFDNGEIPYLDTVTIT